MKKFIALTVLLTSTNVFGQLQNGYFGVSFGIATPLSESKDIGFRNGIALNLINAGYRFNNFLGLTLNWGGFDHNTERIRQSIDYVSFGPIISMPGNKFIFDIKPQIAAFNGEKKTKMNITNSDQDKIEVVYRDGSGFVVGGSFILKVHKSMSISLNGDYIYISKFKSGEVKFPGFNTLPINPDIGVSFQDRDSFMTTIGIQYVFL